MSMRKALIVGIDYYQNGPSLIGCVNDAHQINDVLQRNGDGTINFGIKLLCGIDSDKQVVRSDLRDSIIELFNCDADIALLYFSGHGYIAETGGYIIASDSNLRDDGIPLSDIITYANRSAAKNRIILLDSCHSGIAGNNTSATAYAELKDGMTILTASTEYQYAVEENGSGIFTTLFVDAMNGAAGNLVGDVTPGSVYAHIDQSLGPWDQRPVFKTNVKSFVSLRKVQPPISLQELRQIIQFFPSPGFEFHLDPSFEPERGGSDKDMPEPDPVKTEKFAILQKYNRVNLVVPVDAPHMWHAAMRSKTCKLTVLGEHYRRLVEQNRI